MTRFCKKSPMARRGTFLLLTMLSLAILTGFGTGQQAPPKARPFSGTYEGNLTVPANLPEQYISFTVTGNATHLGRFVLAAAGDLNLTRLELNNGTTTFTAANGDELYTEYYSYGSPNDDDTYTVRATHHIIGGTGRFYKAGGDFTTFSTARLQETPETVTIAGKVYMDGTIIY